MHSSVIKPEGFLSAYVELVYCNKAEDFSDQGISKPSVNSEIFYSFGDHFKFADTIIERDSTELCSLFRNQIIAAPVSAYGKHSTSGIIFKPWAFSSISSLNGKSTGRLTKEAIMFELKTQFRNLEGKLKDSTMADTTALLYSFVEQKVSFKRLHPTFTKIFDAINKFDTAESRIADLVANSNISQKTFIKLFKEHIGLTPHKYLQLRAVEYSLDRLKNPHLSLTQIALESGFYDQSHFNRIFKSFMLITPDRYRRCL
jgi:AraC-like DNA-binding protein